jgi:ATP/maltotriose-dependent transcriptional regulator MalT
MATLLQTKLYVPPVRPERVPRPRLIEQLDTSTRLGHKLILVCAPAGFGKTTLLSDWVCRCGRQVAWLALDQEDSDATRFWTYLIAALQTAHAGLGQSALRALASPQSGPIEPILTHLLNEIAALTGAFVLVLDDYHAISDPSIHTGVAFLLDHLPQQLHVAISTRADPPLPVSRLRARGQLIDLRADDLRFTVDEMACFLNARMGLDLLPEDVTALEARTEGWVAGVQLAALSMQGRADKHAFIAAFTGGHHYILEYLTEEVVRRQPEPVRQFLLQTSILGRLCGPLCDAVTGRADAGTVLQGLYRANLFIVPLDDEHRWVRYHHLFADLLGNLLRKEMPPEHIQALHRRASAWYEGQAGPSGDIGLLDRAIEHALQAHDYEHAASLIEQATGTALSHGSVTTLLRWFKALPEELVHTRPRLSMAWGWAMFLNGQTALAEQTLHKARQVLEGLPPSDDRAALRGQFATLLATLATLHQDMPRAIREAQDALDHLPEEDRVSRARATRALGAAYGLSGDTDRLVQHCDEARSLALAAGNTFLAADIISLIASTQFHQGRLHPSARSYQQIIDLATDPDTFPPAGLGYVGLADIHLEWNDLATAEAYVIKGIDLCHRGGIGHNLLPAYCTKAMIRQASRNTEGALEAMHRAEELDRTGGSLLMSVHLAWQEARFWLLQGKVETAARWACGETMSTQLSLDRLPTVLAEVCLTAMARVHLAQGKPDQVLSIYDRLEPQARAAGRMARVIEISLLKALALQAQGATDAALALFEQCLSLAQAGGYVWLFLEVGAPGAALLRGAVSRGMTPHGAYARRLLAAFEERGADLCPPSTPHREAKAVETLSRREHEVLELIGQGHSNQEIAAVLIVSINTVKKHASTIYGKLGVGSRTQAVARAQELGIL